MPHRKHNRRGPYRELGRSPANRCRARDGDYTLLRKVILPDEPHIDFGLPGSSSRLRAFTSSRYDTPRFHPALAL
jgi:hypothetical protein